jgi:outer membrane protein OmpA-like peptidoglycan-associated protein
MGIKKVIIEGHASADEPNPVPLSLARAQAVVDALIALEVSPERLEARGMGTERPLAPQKTQRAREINRRVEFLIQDF